MLSNFGDDDCLITAFSSKNAPNEAIKCVYRPMAMRCLLLNTLLELGHATSQNLEFAHGSGVFVSYGEETITETNLLELRRRHPPMIRLETFSKKMEAANGADWEWHVIGRRRTLRMRVQAKRLQKNDKLKIPHKIASSGKQQIDLLIADAKNHRMLPVYCFYSSEPQRSYWTASARVAGVSTFEAGCLLASAHKVKSIMPTSLSAIEKHSVPWHYLVDRRRFERIRLLEIVDEDVSTIQFLSSALEIPIAGAAEEKAGPDDTFPTIDELNGDTDLDREYEGVAETSEGRFRPSADAYRERGITKLIEIDVREIPRGVPKDRKA